MIHIFIFILFLFFNKKPFRKERFHQEAFDLSSPKLVWI